MCVLQIREHKKGVDRAVYGPYLLLLQPQQLAVLTLHGEQLTPGGCVHRPAQCHVCQHVFHGLAIVLTPRDRAGLINNMLIADEYCRIKMTGAAQFVGKVGTFCSFLSCSIMSGVQSVTFHDGSSLCTAMYPWRLTRVRQAFQQRVLSPLPEVIALIVLGVQIVNDQVQHEHLRASIRKELDRRRKISEAAQVCTVSLHALICSTCGCPTPTDPIAPVARAVLSERHRCFQP